MSGKMENDPTPSAYSDSLTFVLRTELLLVRNMPNDFAMHAERALLPRMVEFRVTIIELNTCCTGNLQGTECANYVYLNSGYFCFRTPDLVPLALLCPTSFVRVLINDLQRCL